jgi:hypothetical protein
MMTTCARYDSFYDHCIINDRRLSNMWSIRFLLHSIFVHNWRLETLLHMTLMLFNSIDFVSNLLLVIENGYEWCESITMARYSPVVQLITYVNTLLGVHERNERTISTQMLSFIRLYVFGRYQMVIVKMNYVAMKMWLNVSLGRLTQPDHIYPKLYLMEEQR